LKLCGSTQDHRGASRNRTEAEPSGGAHRQRRGAQQTHLRQARSAGDQARHQQEEIDRLRESEEQGKPRWSAEHERLEKERLDASVPGESRRRSVEECKRTAEEEARRQRFWRARRPSANARLPPRARQDHARGGGRQTTLYDRNYIVGDVSSRHKKKKSGRPARSMGGESDTKHGFEMLTARVVREVAIGGR
jgi:hypothetical protein